MTFLRILSQIFGWSYFFSWAISFYPQVYVNFKLRSVEGLHVDYAFLNFSGYIFYSISYTVGFFFKNNPFQNYGLGTIRIQDLVFAYHGFILSTVIGLQSIFYKRGNNKLSKFAVCYAILLWIAAITIFLITEKFGWVQPSEDFNIILCLGYLKLSISLLKYLPIIYWNFKRKSTEGFSALGNILDFSGGLLSVCQNVVDLIDGDTPVLNPVKFTLGNITIIYDIILMYQHYFLYRKNRLSKVESSFKKESKSSDYRHMNSSYDVENTRGK